MLKRRDFNHRLVVSDCRFMNGIVDHDLSRRYNLFSRLNFWRYIVPKGLYFEELEVGWSVATKGRTINVADIVNFAGLSGDFNPLHVDAEYAGATEFGQRIAHGALVLSIATGLAYQEGFMEGTVMAFLSLDWKYSLPTFIGDTIHVELNITELKLMRRLGGGKVVLDVKVVNQDGKIAQKGEWTLLVRSQPAEDAE